MGKKTTIEQTGRKREGDGGGKKNKNFARKGERKKKQSLLWYYIFFPWKLVSLIKQLRSDQKNQKYYQRKERKQIYFNLKQKCKQEQKDKARRRSTKNILLFLFCFVLFCFVLFN